MNLKIMIDIYDIEREYRVKPINITEDYDDRLYTVLNILNNEKLVTPTHFRIFCIYLHSGSSLKASKHCHLKDSQILNIVKKVKTTIKEHYGEYYDRLN